MIRDFTVLTLHCYCGDNVKYRLLSIGRKQQYGGSKNHMG